MTIFGLYLVNILSTSQSVPYGKEKLAVLLKPYDASSYHTYAKALYADGYEHEARQQLRIGKETVLSFPILLPQNFSTREAVLGVTSTLDDLEYLWNNTRNEAQKKYDTWKTIIHDKPDYRDGYIMLALYAIKVQKFDDARVSIERALYLDPTNDVAKKIKEALRHKAD